MLGNDQTTYSNHIPIKIFMQYLYSYSKQYMEYTT